MSATWLIGVSVKDTLKQVKRVIAQASSLHRNMHVAACNCIMSVKVHGDVTAIERMMQGLSGTSVHVAGLKTWFEANAPVKITLDKKSKDNKIKVTVVDGFKLSDPIETVTLLNDLPEFWTVNPPADPFKSFTLEQKWAAFVDEAKKMAKAKATGELTRKGEVIKLTDEQRDNIKLDGWDKIIGGAMPVIVDATKHSHTAVH